MDLYQIELNQLHAVSHTQQYRQMEPSVKMYRSPLSTEFWRHQVLSDGTQRRALLRHHGLTIQIILLTHKLHSIYNYRIN